MKSLYIWHGYWTYIGMEYLTTYFLVAILLLLIYTNSRLSTPDCITFKLDKIMARQEELAQQLRDVTAQNEKARQEIIAKIAALEQAVIDAGNTTPEVDAALADLKASVQADDDMNPDDTTSTTSTTTEA